MPAKRAWEDYPEPVLDADSGCLRWQGPVDRNGYGRIGARGYAHRVAWEREKGPIPEGMTLDHVWKRGCRWRDCVLTEHLEPVEPAENVRRGRAGSNHSSRTHCPQKHPYSPENTRIYRGRRYCRKCHSEREIARKRAKKVSS